MIDQIIRVILAILAIATLAIVLSKKSNLVPAVKVVSDAINGLLKTATKPITG